MSDDVLSAKLKALEKLLEIQIQSVRRESDRSLDGLTKQIALSLEASKEAAQEAKRVNEYRLAALNEARQMALDSTARSMSRDETLALLNALESKFGLLNDRLSLTMSRHEVESLVASQASASVERAKVNDAKITALRDEYNLFAGRILGANKGERSAHDENQATRDNNRANVALAISAGSVLISVISVIVLVLRMH